MKTGRLIYGQMNHHITISQLIATQYQEFADLKVIPLLEFRISLVLDD